MLVLIQVGVASLRRVKHTPPYKKPKPRRINFGVAKRREGVKKQHSALFFPERDRAAARSLELPQVFLLRSKGRYPLATPGEQALRSPFGVCEPDSVTSHGARSEARVAAQDNPQKRKVLP